MTPADIDEIFQSLKERVPLAKLCHYRQLPDLYPDLLVMDSCMPHAPSRLCLLEFLLDRDLVTPRDRLRALLAQLAVLAPRSLRFPWTTSTRNSWSDARAALKAFAREPVDRDALAAVYGPLSYLYHCQAAVAAFMAKAGIDKQVLERARPGTPLEAVALNYLMGIPAVRKLVDSLVGSATHVLRTRYPEAFDARDPEPQSGPRPAESRKRNPRRRKAL